MYHEFTWRQLQLTETHRRIATFESELMAMKVVAFSIMKADVQPALIAPCTGLKSLVNRQEFPQDRIAKGPALITAREEVKALAGRCLCYGER